MYEIREIDERRGRGVFSLIKLAQGTIITSVRCPLSVLYSPFVRTHCGFCFIEVAESAWMCTDCRHYALCAVCDCEGLRAAHEGWCQWFRMLPEAVRAGDTDYVRFVLEYCARILRGDTDLLEEIRKLTFADIDAAFCESFSARIVERFGPHGLAVSSEHIAGVIRRTKTNSLGFPFDSERTLGWSIHSELCMLNHSCIPNCAIRRSSSVPGAAELVAVTDVERGDELTISYIDVESFPDVVARTTHLLERYAFLCRCELCQSQRKSSRR